MASDGGRCATLPNSAKHATPQGAGWTSRSQPGASEPWVLKEVSGRPRERKNARTQRNFGHGEQGVAEQQGLMHSTVGGARNLRKGRRSTINAAHTAMTDGQSGGASATQDRTTNTDSAQAKAWARPRKRVSARQGASPERHFERQPLATVSETLTGASSHGRKLDVAGRIAQGVLDRAEPQGLAKTSRVRRSGAKDHERLAERGVNLSLRRYETEDLAERLKK